MAIEEWMLTKYQSAAVEMCYRLNQNPYAPTQSNLVGVTEVVMPQWMINAYKMFEHETMLKSMRDFGHIV